MTGIVLMAALALAPAAADPPEAPSTTRPLVLLVGCAAPTAEPRVWKLSRVGERTEVLTPGIQPADREAASKRSPGEDTYELVGVADFATPEQSLAVGDRAKVLDVARVNATGQLREGHKTAVKGLFIPTTPPRVNLTSVVDLGATCP